MRLLLPTPPQRPWSRRAGGLASSILAHAAGAAVLLWLAAQPPAGMRASRSEPDAGPVVATVTPAEIAAFPERTPVPREETMPDAAPGDLTQLDLAGLTFDLARIRARRHLLFPFLTTDLDFLAAIEARAQATDGALLNPWSRGRPSDPARPPLAVTDARLQALVDRSWSRQHRWTRFAEIAALARSHDPDRGQLPALLQAYLDQNILQPYYDGRGRDPRFWVMLSLSADHAEFIAFVRGYARRDPSSRATTELLFLLDELLQGSRDAMVMLLDTEPARDLGFTAAADRDAYDLAVEIRRHYRGWLRDRQLDSADAIRRRYDEIRLRLLSTIVAASPAGYRAADARFLAGELLFRQGRLADAVTWWRAITPRPGDSYFEAYSELLPAVRDDRGGLAAKAIAILGGERGRWLERSRTRLRQFGYSFDTF